MDLGDFEVSVLIDVFEVGVSAARHADGLLLGENAVQKIKRQIITSILVSFASMHSHIASQA